MALPVLIIDHASWIILAVNDAALEQYGYEREEFAEATPLHERVGPRGAPTVLVVDDVDDVRRATCRVLADLGWTVISRASSAEEALAAFEGSGETPDLLVTALSLSGMDGVALADRFQSLNPGLGVLFLSSYAVEENDSVRSFTGGRGLLKKPFSVESLSDAVRRVLAGS